MSWRSRTYDELPALAVRGNNLRYSLRIVTGAWMVGIIWMTLTMGAHVTQFCQMLGFSQFDFGLMAAIPFIATFGQLIAAVIVERTGLRKYQFVECLTVSRLLWIPIAALPFLLTLSVPPRSAVVLMLILLWAINFLVALGTPAFMSWLGDLVPRRLRGRYFARRFAYARPMQIVTVIGLWIVLDWAGSSTGSIPTFHDSPRLMWTISGIFIAAAVFGVIDILLFLRIPEMVRSYRGDGDEKPSVQFDVQKPQGLDPLAIGRYWASYSRQVYLQLIDEPMRNASFRRYVLFSATMAFAMAAPGAFFMLNCLNNLKLSMGATQFLFLVVSPIMGLVGASQWGRALDRWGRRPVLMVGATLTLVSVMPWFFARSDTPAPLFLAQAVNAVAAWAGPLIGKPGWVVLGPGAPVGAFLIAMLSSFFGGIAWTGVALAQNNILLSYSDGRGRSKYVAAAAVLASVGGILGGLTGGTVAQHLQFLQAHPLEWGIFRWNQWHVTFAISFVTRALAVLWLVNMVDPGAGRTRDMARYMVTSTYNNLAALVTFPLRVFGRSEGDEPQGPTQHPKQKAASTTEREKTR